MKRFWKIFGITLASLIAFVLLVVGSVVYVVFTPKRLTPIVNQVTDTLVTCPYSIEEVNLTFFRTFPNFGVAVRGLYVINPMEGAPSDTVLAVPELVVSVDLKKAIKGDIFIRHFSLNDVEANLYIAADGTTNFDVLRLPESSPKDTTDTVPGWQLRSLGWEDALRVSARKLCFVDEPDTISASLNNLQLTIGELYRDNCQGAKIDLTARQIACALKGVQYADGVNLNLTLPVLLADGTERVIIDGTQVGVNEFEIQLDGTVGTPCFSSGIYTCDLNLQTNDWQISSVVALLPEQYRSLIPKEIEADGKIHLQAHAYGQYDSITMPLIDARIALKDAAGHYDLKVLPYRFQAFAADIAAHVDLNNNTKTTADIKRLYARTGETSVTLQGTVRDIFRHKKDFDLGNPLCNMIADMKVNLDDINYWLPKTEAQSALHGRLAGRVTLLTRLNDILNFNLNKMKVKGDLAIDALNVLWQDSTMATADRMTIVMTAPRPNISDPNILSADCSVGLKNLHALVLPAKMDALVDGGTLTGEVEIDTQDTTLVPTLAAGFDLGDLRFVLDSISAHAVAPKGKVMLTGSRRNKAVPRLSVDFAAQAMQANMGEGLKASSGIINIEARALYKADADNILLKWNPRLKFDLQNAHADIALLGTPVEIPQIKFAYSNRECVIDTSRIVLGKSDFSLGGEFKNLGLWLRKEGELTGSLRFTSDRTDVNELLTIVDHVNKTTGNVAPQDSTATAATKQKEDKDPFMVPEHVDLTLMTTIRNAYAFDQHLKNLGGRIYVQDGKLILEEMGFVCEAAKLQLTAMYQTPRRNHLYVGFDYHMIDIDIQQLISMIPQLDTMVPMLREFKGGAQFHIAAETYLNSKYEPKTSTLRGACSVEGKNLVLMDSKTFSTISKILMFNRKTENLIDSISVQIALYKDEVTVYPFCVSIDNYMAAVGGNHYLDMNFNYHASLLKPFYIGVDVGGNLDDLKIKAAKCRYAKDFRPLFHKDADTHSAELRRIISSSLKRNVKIQ